MRFEEQPIFFEPKTSESKTFGTFRAVIQHYMAIASFLHRQNGNSIKSLNFFKIGSFDRKFFNHDK